MLGFHGDKKLDIICSFLTSQFFMYLRGKCKGKVVPVIN
jgi:hypothetical protein